MLSNEEKYRYSRHLLLGEVGVQGQEKLKEAKVLVIGAGGLGCPVLLYLCAAGVGTIGIVDFDEIDESNLQRQIIFDHEDVGKSKAEIAKKKLQAKNPFINVVSYNEALTTLNAINLFNEYDIMIDGTDNFSTRYLVNDACVITNKPLVYGAIYKFEGQVSVFNYNDGPSYRCLFPDPPAQGSVPSCSEVGVIGVLPGLIGTQQANEALKIILGIGTVLSGRLMIFDALSATPMELKVDRVDAQIKEVLQRADEFESYDYDFFCAGPSDEMEQITKDGLEKLPSETVVLDVREEWEQPKISGKQVLYISLGDIDKYVGDIPKKNPVYVLCQKGVRSKAVIKYLTEEYNFNNLINVDGGMAG